MEKNYSGGGGDDRGRGDDRVDGGNLVCLIVSDDLSCRLSSSVSVIV